MHMDQEFEESSFKEIANITLGGYQLIEARIKTYLNDYFEIVKHKVGSDLHFGFEGKDYKTAALGTLLKVFSKTCSDSALVKDLQAEVPHRDHVAHQALLILYKRQKCSPMEIRELSNELSVRAQSITKLLDRLKIAHTELVTPYQ